MMNTIKNFIKNLLYWKWYFHLQHTQNISLRSDEKATAIILSYKRMQNIGPIVLSFLKCYFIEKIIVSNNNPSVRIEDWVKVTDERVVLINQPVKRRCGYRWFLAKNESSPYFIIIDDDAFLYPRQIAKLFEALIQEPTIPHGAKGTVMHFLNLTDKQEFTRHYFQQQEMEVNFLHQLYFTTQQQVQTYFEHIEKISISDPSIRDYLDPLSSDKEVGDDLIISQTGLGKPKIHDVGLILTCPTQHTKGIAINTETDFRLIRRQIIQTSMKLNLNTLWSDPV